MKIRHRTTDRVTRREAAGLDPSEHTEAVRFMRRVRAHEEQHPHLRFLHSIPNGGKRKKSVAAKMKMEGQRAGVLDYFWPYKAGTYPGLYIELKTVRKGKRSKEQREFAAFAESQGYMVVFAKGWREAWAAVCDYAGLPYTED
jgi:hypothetical protein